MIREDKSSQQDIYLLSLDTFMIMAVMGITIGILFILFNPTLKGSASTSGRLPMLKIINQVEYQRMLESSNVLQMSFNGEKEYLDNLLSNQRVQIVIRDGGLVQKSYYTRNASGGIQQLALIFTPLSAGKYRTSLKYVNPSGGTIRYRVNSDDDELAKTNNEQIIASVIEWDGLYLELFEKVTER